MLNLKLAIPAVYSGFFMKEYNEILGKWMIDKAELKEGLGIDYVFDTLILKFGDYNPDIVVFCVESLLQSLLDWNQDIFTKGSVSMRKIDHSEVGYVVQTTARWRSGGKAKVKKRIKKGQLPASFIKSELLS